MVLYDLPSVVNDLMSPHSIQDTATMTKRSRTSKTNLKPVTEKSPPTIKRQRGPPVATRTSARLRSKILSAAKGRASANTRLHQEDAENDGSESGDKDVKLCEPEADTNQSSVEILSVKNREMKPRRYIGKKDETVGQGNYYFLTNP